MRVISTPYYICDMRTYKSQCGKTRNSLLSIEKFVKYVHSTQCGNYGNSPPLQKFSVKLIYSICNSLVKKLIWRNFCKISWGKNLQISTLWYVRAHIAYIHVCSMVWKLPSSHQNIISWSQLSTLVITYFII